MLRSNCVLMFLAFLLGLFTYSCQGPQQPAESNTENEEMTEEAPDELEADWNAAKEAYHEVMAATFHPAEEGDLAPLKEQYGELAARAEAWAQMPMPPVETGKGLEDLLQQLKEQSAAIGQVVENGTDEELEKAIFDLHDVFHEIVGKCSH